MEKVNRLLLLFVMLVTISATSYADVIEAQYYDSPITINASKNALNLIKLPYQIIAVHSSKDGYKFGQGDKEFTVTLPTAYDSDFAIITAEKTFMINLHPIIDGATVINISDRAIGNNGYVVTSPIYDICSDLMKAMYVHSGIRGFYQKVKKETIRIDDIGVMNEIMLYEGVSFIGKIYTYYNNTEKTQRFSTESSDFINMMKKVAKTTSYTAIAVSNENILPKETSEIYLIMAVK